jgi:predicted component of type VI protein secretion system
MTTQVTLTATGGGLKDQPVAFAGHAQVLIGRSRDCSLRVDDPTVSRRHCLIEVGDEAAFVWDLRSLNGTVVNGHLLRGREGLCRLHDGDELRLGDSTFRVGLAPAPSETEPAPSALSA